MSIRRLAVAALLVLALGACSHMASPPKSYTPTREAYDNYESAVESDLGASFLARISDETSFASAIEAAGDIACRDYLAGGTRDQWQKAFRDQAAGTVNGARVSDTQLDAFSLDIWAEALKGLCPS